MVCVKPPQHAEVVTPFAWLLPLVVRSPLSLRSNASSGIQTRLSKSHTFDMMRSTVSVKPAQHIETRALLAALSVLTINIMAIPMATFFELIMTPPY